MLRSARTKIATKVSKLETADDFQFSRWLRPPQLFNEQLTPLKTYDEVKSFKIEKFQIPTLLKLKFKLQEISVLNSKSFLTIVKPRAYLIFFGLTRPQLFTMREKFLKEPLLNNYNSAFLFNHQVIDQSDIFIVKPAETIRYEYSGKETISTSISFNSELPSIKEYHDLLNESRISDVQVAIPVPVITDHLASLVPEIYNIELLNEEKLENIVIDSRSFDVKKLRLPIIDRIEVPGIDDILKTSAKSYSIPLGVINKPELKYFSSEINLSSHIYKVKSGFLKTVVKKVVIKHDNFETKIIDGLNDEKIPAINRENIRLQLSSYKELTWDEYAKTLITLDKFESDGAKFLSETNFAVYGEELGYEEFIQAISAFNFLFKKGNIKSVLIISDKIRLYSSWKEKLSDYSKNLIVKKIDPEKREKIDGYGTVWLLDINDLSKYDIKQFNKIDLIVLDEQINLKSTSDIINELVDKTEPGYIWFLTTIINQKYNKKFLENFNFTSKVEFNFYGKTLEEIQQEEPIVTYKDFWLQLDEMQSFEYTEALNQAKEELSKLLKNPNPIRFQSNIFTLIHKLKQILNFSAFRNISPKANLLIEHSEAIYRNKKKAIVFTQYDENGIKKIEKAFEMNNIKNIVARNGISTEELKSYLNNFYDRKEIPILLTNIKPSRLNINLNKISYIINFDQWWNPISTWQTDDEIGLNEVVLSPVMVFNYMIKDSFEEDLKRLLAEKGLYNRHLLDNLKSETVSELIQMNDWLSVFGMNNDYVKNVNTERIKILNKLKKIDLESFKYLMKSFFTFLGYRDISIMDIENEPMFYIIGTARRGTTPVNLHGKCSLTTGLKNEDYEEVIHLKQGSNEIKRKFVITTGEFAEKIINGTTYLDGFELANYLLTLGLKSFLDRK